MDVLLQIVFGGAVKARCFRVLVPVGETLLLGMVSCRGDEYGLLVVQLIHFSENIVQFTQ